MKPTDGFLRTPEVCKRIVGVVGWARTQNVQFFTSYEKKEWFSNTKENSY